MGLETHRWKLTEAGRQCPSWNSLKFALFMYEDINYLQFHSFTELLNGVSFAMLVSTRDFNLWL